MLRVLPPSFKALNNRICYKTGLMWVKNAQHRYSTHFASMLQDKLPFFLVRFAVPLRPYLTDSFFFALFSLEICPVSN